jgi:hypothetical protein
MGFLKRIRSTLELAFVLFYGQYGKSVMIAFLTTQVFHLFSGYSFSYPLDPYVVLSTIAGRASGYEYWVQPIGDSSMGFLQPVRMVY